LGDYATIFRPHGPIPHPEGVAADITGHKKQTMTYGLYSARTLLEKKRKALAKAVYPAPLDKLR